MATRRIFLQSSTAGAAALSAQAQTKTSPNDKIRIALIGAGGMGSGDVQSSLATGMAEMVAACDVYEDKLTRAKQIWGNGLFTTRDYREVLARKDVDAVIIATPDHWHAKISIDAMEAGKDVYCEKPMVQKVAEGKPVIEAQKRTGRIFQVGSQRVSSVEYAKAKELLAAGAIGDLNFIEAWWDRNSSIGAWQYSISPDATPQNISWDTFIGQAEKRAFEPARLFRWRNYKDYGTGVAGDLFVHLFSGMHFITGAIGPERIYATGGLRFWNDGRDVPDVMLGLYDYPKTANHPAFNLALRVNFVNGAGENSGFRFVGSGGVMTVGDGVRVMKTPRELEPGNTAGNFSKEVAAKVVKEYQEKYPAIKTSTSSMRAAETLHFAAPRSYSDHLDHHRNWLQAIKTRKPVVEDALFGFRAAAPALLSNTSYFEQRAVKWNPEKGETL
jgi:predicted dehydrogenase